MLSKINQLIDHLFKIKSSSEDPSINNRQLTLILITSTALRANLIKIKRFIDQQKENLQLPKESQTHDIFNTLINHLPSPVPSHLCQPLITQLKLDALIQETPPKQWPTLFCNTFKKQTIDFIKPLINGINPNHHIWKTTVLHAIDQDNAAYLSLLHQGGLDFNKLDNQVLPFLVRAAHRGSESTFLFLFSIMENINPIAVGIGNTILHAVACSPKPSKKIIHLILENDKTKNQVISKNYYDMTPLELAVQMNKPVNANLIAKITQQSLPKNKKQVISHDLIIEKIRAYIKIQLIPEQLLVGEALTHYQQANSEEKSAIVNRLINDYVDVNGICNACFLFNWYYSKYETANVFYEIINHISEWNGSKEALSTPLTIADVKQPYQTLGELFEQFVNDVVWFFHGTTVIKEALHYKSGDVGDTLEYHFNRQTMRQFQFEHVQPHESKIKFSSLARFDVTPLTHAQLSELIREFIQMYANHTGVCIEFGGDRHKTTVRILPNGHLIYFDISNPYRPKLFQDPEELSTFIQSTKYSNRHRKMPIDFYIYTLSSDAKPTSSPPTYPDYPNSPNSWTSFHRDVMYNHSDVLSTRLTQISNPTLCNQEDAHGFTPLMRAINLHRSSCFNLLLTYLLDNNVLKTNLDPFKLTNLCYQHNNLDAFEKIIKHYPEHREALLSQEIFSRYTPHLIDFYKTSLEKYTLDLNKIFLVTVESFFLDGLALPAAPLRLAIERHDVELFSLAIHHGADLKLLQDDAELYHSGCEMLTALKEKKQSPQRSETEFGLFKTKAEPLDHSKPTLLCQDFVPQHASSQFPPN